MLTVRDLWKTYPNGVRALSGVSLHIPRGIFGLLGANGAGKSTLMKIVATLIRADRGSVAFDGIDVMSNPRELRRCLGYLPQDFGFYPTLTAEETLAHFGRLKEVGDLHREVDALLERVNLTDVRKQRAGGFSTGMRQRLGIAQALLGRPRLLIVDEPTAGLDPEERLRFHDVIREAAREAVILFSTHIVADVAGLCDAMAILHRGEVIDTTTPEDALKRSPTLQDYYLNAVASARAIA